MAGGGCDRAMVVEDEEQESIPDSDGGHPFSSEHVLSLVIDIVPGYILYLWSSLAP